MDYLSKLLDRKQEIEEALANSREFLMTPLAESTDELSLYDQHPADSASELYEREKTAGMAELLEIELEKTNQAIEQYQNNRYGLCEMCGQPIEPARLDRLVNTTLCARCAHYAAPESIRPAEEDVISPGNMSDYGEAFQVAGYELYEE